MAVEIRVLGRVDAIVDGRSLPVKGGKQRAVLAMLALRANRAVAAGELIDGLWGDRPPASAAKNVQYYVSQLRKPEIPATEILRASRSGIRNPRPCPPHPRTMPPRPGGSVAANGSTATREGVR